jgi:putative tricarboxylic transport membrane protein
MLLPTTVYRRRALRSGIYVPGALLIGYFMKRHGKFGWPTTA